jgi:branched-chain amino acid transport system substrate-binding protein
MNQQKRKLMLAGVLGTAAASLGVFHPLAMAQEREVKVGLIVPLSGPWARQGDFMLKGAEQAVTDINKGGGVKALGGAKLKLVVADAGENTEKAKNAAQRMVAEHTDLVGLSGAWVSSFTLAVTEVTERAEVPVLTTSFADQITARGFKYIFQTSAPAATQSANAIPAILEVAREATGKTPKTVGIVMDNTASPVGFTKPMREPGGLDKLGMKIVTDEIFTPPLADASSIVQKLRATRPELLLLVPSSLPDNKLILERMNEVGLGKGRIPIITNGAHMAAPETVKILGKDLLEGVFVIVANWSTKGQEKVIADFKARTGEPWMPQDSISTYGDMWMFKDAMEKAGSADRRKVADAMRAMNTTSGAARYYSGGLLKFDERGRREKAGIVVLQWQNGEPVAVYPKETAVAKAVWPKR